MELIIQTITTGNFVWFTFVISAAVIVFAAMKLASNGDVIAARTKISGMFVGVLLLAGATSLPEMLTGINSVLADEPNLAAGNFFGSSAFNMFILAILDVIGKDQRILRSSALKHTLSGSLAVFLCTLVLFFLCANPLLASIHFQIGWVGIDSIIIAAFYVFSVYLINKNDSSEITADLTEEELKSIPSLKAGIFGFILASALLMIATPLMVRSSATISDITGLGTSFIGSTLVAIITSLPELVTSIAALKISAPEMAMGNLFGSNMFNMFGLALTDMFYTKGRFIGAIDQSFLIAGMLGVLLTSLALVGNVTSFRRFRHMESDSVIMTIIYLAGTYLLYIQSRV
ncbi:sodium:calcium antiporter [Flexilinea flocculi]|uniref:Ca2+/Na+ antiporter n=1 Tax=Flexilinea flocculi TaxID=1678840 RepID=A0A0S7BL74_9CHLR|nr:sodium:calcium antiporter [Flexilinea flocculi]GAP41050.1 Ca2+/Na+ antiporter [Flexilinea flocculi]